MKFIEFFLLVIAFSSCQKKEFGWNLPRSNKLDSLQNTNPAGDNFPIANFYSSSSSVPIGSSVTFYSSSKKSPTTFTWGFPGGSPEFSDQSTCNVSYNNIGWYDVSLKVSNNNGIDSITKLHYIQAYYLKSFDNGLWDGWVNNGWNFSGSPNPNHYYNGCIYAWGRTNSSISKAFDNVSFNSTLEFYIVPEGGVLNVKVNDNLIWTSNGYNTIQTVSIPLPNISNFTLTFEAVLDPNYNNAIHINNIKIKP